MIKLIWDYFMNKNLTNLKKKNYCNKLSNFLKKIDYLSNIKFIFNKKNFYYIFNYIIVSFFIWKKKIYQFFSSYSFTYFNYPADDLLKQVSESAKQTYDSATEIANAKLKTAPPHQTRYIALNFSVFHWEVLNDPSIACNLAKIAFDDAIADI